MELPARVGQSIRSVHCAPGKRSAKVTRKATGCAWYCFRCPPGENNGWIPDVLSLRQRMVPVRGDYSRRAPAPAGSPIPTVYLGWLARFGIDAPAILDLGAYWSEAEGRLCFPIPALSGTGSRVAGRSNDAIPKWWIYTGSASADYVPGYPGGSGLSSPVLAVTEDHLSAWKIAQAGIKAMPLIGTRVTDVYLTYMLGHSNVILALDPDEQGQLHEGRLESRLRTLGVKTYRPHLPKDPKYIPVSEIKYALS